MAKTYDLVQRTKQLKGEMLSFFLDFKQWRTFKSRYRLDWEKLRFSPASQALIPKQRGIYAFTAELFDGKLPLHGYILYMGITGDGTSKATLHSRYSQYMGQARDQKGRPRVTYMLSNWSDDLFFNFVPLPNPSVNLKTIETKFMDAVMPPVNVMDFSADIAQARKAFMN